MTTYSEAVCVCLKTLSWIFDLKLLFVVSGPQDPCKKIKPFFAWLYVVSHATIDNVSIRHVARQHFVKRAADPS